jgi:hypothetical protein
MPKISSGTAGLIFLGIAEVPQIMSAFLPSPTTAFMGGADPVRVAWLRRGEIIGGGVSMVLAMAIGLVAKEEAGKAALLIPAGSAAVLGLFLMEYERAIRMGQKANGGQASGQGY